MTFFDIVLLIIPAIGFIRGLMKGLLYTFTTLGGYLVGGFLAFSFYSLASYSILEFLGLSSNAFLSSLIFLLLFATPIFLFRIIEKLLRTALNWLSVGFFNYIIGGLAGAIKYLGILLVILYLIQKIPAEYVQHRLAKLQQESFVFEYYINLVKIFSTSY